MIFYFTGTGNSYDAALQIAGSDKLINITECVHNNQYAFSLEDNENLGFVFPVYYGGLPSIVCHFVDQLELNSQPAYMFGVITCGGDACGAGHMLSRLLSDRGYQLDAAYTVRMPDNYILMYEPESDEERMIALEQSKVILAGIKEKIEMRAKQKPDQGIKARMATAIMYPLYVRGRKTKKFWVDEKCVGCGICAGRCPQKAIEMRDGKPVWVKERCIQCLSCVRCRAIQYGKKTVGRERYTNPVLKKN